jgi:ABC-type long-subunit fatty acid transport system fused permease/ATPase subunit
VELISIYKRLHAFESVLDGEEHYVNLDSAISM